MRLPEQTVTQRRRQNRAQPPSQRHRRLPIRAPGYFAEFLSDGENP